MSLDSEQEEACPDASFGDVLVQALGFQGCKCLSVLGQVSNDSDSTEITVSY